VVSQQ